MTTTTAEPKIATEPLDWETARQDIARLQDVAQRIEQEIVALDLEIDAAVRAEDGEALQRLWAPWCQLQEEQ